MTDKDTWGKNMKKGKENGNKEKIERFYTVFLPHFTYRS
jgi:hypothetical protein